MENMLENILVGVEEDIANLQLPSPQLRDYYRDEQERVFWVDDQIDSGLLDLVKMIVRCNHEDKGKPVEERVPIKVYIDSPGGDVCALYTTIKAIEISKTPVYTINYCTAYSAAADLLAAGHKRFAFPGTNIMVHSGSCMYAGTVEQADNMKKYFDNLGKKLTDYFLAHTKVESRLYKKKAPYDWYLDEDEALKYGIIDAVVSDFDELF